MWPSARNRLKLLSRCTVRRLVAPRNTVSTSVDSGSRTVSCGCSNFTLVKRIVVSDRSTLNVWEEPPNVAGTGIANGFDSRTSTWITSNDWESNQTLPCMPPPSAAKQGPRHLTATRSGGNWTKSTADAPAGPPAAAVGSENLNRCWFFARRNDRGSGVPVFGSVQYGSWFFLACLPLTERSVLSTLNSPSAVPTPPFAAAAGETLSS